MCRVVKLVSLMIGRHYIDFYNRVTHIARIINLCLAFTPALPQAAEKLLFMLYVKVGPQPNLGWLYRSRARQRTIKPV
jgi:hypothetical protein